MKAQQQSVLYRVPRFSRVHRVSGCVTLAVIAIATALLWSYSTHSCTPTTFHINRQKHQPTQGEDDAVKVTVIPDSYRQKYPPARAAVFHLTSSDPVSTFVLATGVEIRTDSGWEPFSEEPRNEVWRLTPGTAQEIYVERPPVDTHEVWRAYVRYSAEIKGPPLWKAQIREAWQTQSFSNWNGAAGGGGRFASEAIFYSEEFSEWRNGRWNE